MNAEEKKKGKASLTLHVQIIVYTEAAIRTADWLS